MHETTDYCLLIAINLNHERVIYFLLYENIWIIEIFTQSFTRGDGGLQVFPDSVVAQLVSKLEARWLRHLSLKIL